MKRGERKILTGLGVSAVMNAASYAFLSAVIAAAIYLPAASCRDNMPLSDLSGKLVIFDYLKRTQTIEFPGKSHPVKSSCLDCTVVNDGGKRRIIDKSTGKTLGFIKSGFTYKGGWAISSDGRFYANWVYGNARLGVGRGDLVVGDTKTGKVRVFSKPGEYLFSPVDSRLAIIRSCTIYNPANGSTKNRRSCTIYNPADGSTKTIGIPCMSGSEGIAWSPDGKYIAYLADMSPYNHDNDDLGDSSYMDAVRVISADGKKSVTVRRRQGDFYWWHMEWTE